MTSLCFLCYAVLIAGVANCKEDKVFRSDYQYFSEADGWFKLHRMPVNWQTARLRCAYEGAIIASPTDYGLTAVIMSLLAKHNVAVYTGIHATVSAGDFNSLDGVPISEIQLKWLSDNPNNWNNSENCIFYTRQGSAADVDCNNPYPYICYRKHTSDLIMTECGTTDREYKIDNRTNKCYKFHRIGRPYSDAAAVCSAEGGHLAIINSEVEAEVLKNLLAEHPAQSLAVSYPNEIRLGFFNWDESNFFGTLHGESLEMAGYAKWSDGQPNYLDGGKPQRCGGMFRSGLLDDTYCDNNLAFICEKHPDSLHLSSIDTRLGRDNY